MEQFQCDPNPLKKRERKRKKNEKSELQKEDICWIGKKCDWREEDDNSKSNPKIGTCGIKGVDPAPLEWTLNLANDNLLL